MTTNDTLENIIAAVLGSESPTLDISADDAKQYMDAIMASDRDDAHAMTAYDLLHSRFTYGRAF
jgi:hypothetical protein